jgi:hypothetical protein
MAGKGGMMDSHKRRRALAACALLLATCITTGVRADSRSLYAAPTCQEVERAGNPRKIAFWARPQNSCAYDGYFVGGGSHMVHTLERSPDQGTWGWDFVGRCCAPTVKLTWTNPPRMQAGTGAYEPDGPHCCKKLHGHESHSH